MKRNHRFKLWGSIIIIVGLCIGYEAIGQSQAYAKAILDSLCSAEMHGRGYVENGEQKAAAYLAREFQRLGVSPLGSTYLQHFELQANTFPSLVSVTLNKKRLNPGEDYLVDADAPPCQGTYEMVTLTIEDLIDEQRLTSKLMDAVGKFILLDNAPFQENAESKQFLEEFLLALKYLDGLDIAGIVLLTDEKLTWAPAPRQALRPVLRIRKESSPKKIRNISIHIESQFLDSVSSSNVLATIEGNTYPDSIIMVSAHYDHLGTMGKGIYFPGANDNASGVAMLLNLASWYSQHPPEKTLVFAAFGGEELGLLGSQYFVEHSPLALDSIKFLINLDILGTGDDGIQIVNGAVYKLQFEQLKAINQKYQLLNAVKIRGAACISDHCFFHERGVPCFYIYTLGGIAAYHDIYDKPATLPLTAFENLQKLLIYFIDDL